MNSSTMQLKQLFFLFVAILFFFPACQDDESVSLSDEKLVKNENATVAVAWMEFFLEMDRFADGYRPGPCPRTLAYINMAAYESVMNGMPEYKSLQHLFPGLNLPSTNANEVYHWPTVVNAVYATTIKRFIPGSVLLTSKQIELQFKLLEIEHNFYEDFEPIIGTKEMEDRKSVV